MASGSMSLAGGTISQVGGFCVYAEAVVGSDGASGGPPELYVGHDGADAASTRMVWDSDPSDGLSSGDVPVELVAEVGGGAAGVKWDVDGAAVSPLVYTGTTYRAVGVVRIRAGVKTAARAAWKNVSVKWYRGTRLAETFVAAVGPVVDTRSGGSSVVAEQILEVTPAFTTHTRVVVGGEVSLDCPEGTVPEADDLFLQIYVNAASCTQL